MPTLLLTLQLSLPCVWGTLLGGGWLEVGGSSVSVDAKARVEHVQQPLRREEGLAWLGIGLGLG